MSDLESRVAPLLRRWLPAIGLSLLGTYILWGAYPGINWGIWILGVVSVFLGIGYYASKRLKLFPVITGVFAVLIAFGVAVTAREALQPVVLIAVWSLLALMVTYESFQDVRIRNLLLAPWRAVKAVVLSILREFSDASTRFSSPATRPFLRGALVTLPVIVILFLLLAHADPMFELAQTTLSRLAPDLFSGRMIFGVILFLITLGMFGNAAYRIATQERYDGAQRRVIPLGETEWGILIGAVAVIMWLFVISAVVSLLANPAAQAGTGVTYAEYARRGFAELSIAATLVAGIVLILNHNGLSRNHRIRRFMLAALAAVVVILGLAFVRVVNYEMAYGYTVVRVYAQGYMIVLLVGIGAITRDVLRPLSPPSFLLVMTGAILLVFTGGLYWNVESWVVHRNIDRYAVTGKLDTEYLQRLSLDAFSALDERLPEVHESQRRDFWENYVKSNPPRERRWFQWNWRREQAERLYRTYSLNLK